MREPQRRNDEEDYQYTERRNNFKAFMSRCKLTEIKTSHQNNEEFPYTANQLAVYMNHLCNTMDPIIEDEVLSELEEEPIEV